jgi:hypothetical protein
LTVEKAAQAQKIILAEDWLQEAPVVQKHCQEIGRQAG